MILARVPAHIAGFKIRVGVCDVAVDYFFSAAQILRFALHKREKKLPLDG